MRARAALRGVIAALAAAPGVAHASFERPPAGPECAAVAEILSVGSDPAFGNPAFPFDAANFRVDAWSAHPFGIAELRETQCSGSIKGSRGGAGGGFRSLGTPDYFEREVRATLSFAPTSGLSLGGAVRVLFAGGAAFAMERSVAGDAGLRARLDDSTELGLSLESVVGETPGDPDRRLARSSIGFARALPWKARVLVEVGRRADRNPAVAAGATWSPSSGLTLRAGFREEPLSYAWGATVRVGGVGLSFSCTESDPLGRTLRVGAGYARRPSRN